MMSSSAVSTSRKSTPPASRTSSGRAGADVVIINVVERVGADDEIVRTAQPQSRQLVERRLAKIARLAEARHRVVARIEPEVLRAGTQRLDVRLPRPFAAGDVEHGAQDGGG